MRGVVGYGGRIVHSDDVLHATNSYSPLLIHKFPSPRPQPPRREALPPRILLALWDCVCSLLGRAGIFRARNGNASQDQGERRLLQKQIKVLVKTNINDVTAV